MGVEWQKLAKNITDGGGGGQKIPFLRGKRNQDWVKQRPTNSEATALNMGGGKGGEIGGRMAKMGQKGHGLGPKNLNFEGKRNQGQWCQNWGSMGPKLGVNGAKIGVSWRDVGWGQ